MSGELQRAALFALPAPPAPELPGEALKRLPLVDGDVDPYWRVVTAFLAHRLSLPLGDLGDAAPSARVDELAVLDDPRWRDRGRGTFHTRDDRAAIRTVVS